MAIVFPNEKCCDVCYPREDGKPPLSVCEKSLKLWQQRSSESIERARIADMIKRDPPPGTDPDDNHKYVIRLPE